MLKTKFNVLQTCTCLDMYEIAFLIMDHSLSFRYLLSNGTMVLSNPLINNWMTLEQQMMTKFLSYQELIGSQSLCNIDEGFSDAFDLCLDKGSQIVGAIQHQMQNAVLLPFQSVSNSCVLER